MARRFRGAVNNSFFSTAHTLSSSVGNTVGTGSNNNAKTVIDFDTLHDEVDKMKERAKKNNMFVYIIIPPVPFIVSYKVK